MARPRAKRATRPNPREDRNFNSSKNSENIIQVEFNKPIKKKKIEILPRSINQEILLDALDDDNVHVVFASGPAGSGKTLMATLMAIKGLREGRYDKIVITRPNVAVDDRDIGFLPGDIFQKMMPWTKPISDIFMEYYSKREYTAMLEEEIIEICPLAFIRGRTFKNSIIILDEAQGCSPNSLLAVLTRIGEGSKIVVTGDLNQSDKVGSNGLSDFIAKWNNQSKGIKVINFSNKDVERHPVIKDILKIYNLE